MKKKILLIIMVIVVSCFGIMGLTACDNYTADDNGIIFRMVDKRYVVYGIESDATTTDILIPARFENVEVAGIAREAFKGNTKITSVAITEGIRSIASSAFEGCTALESVSIANSVTLLGTYIFRNCTALEDVGLPSSLSVLSGGMFYGCTALTSIDLPASTTRISDNAFEKSGLTSITIPNAVTEIGERAFASCEDLASVTLSNRLLMIDLCAFTKCESLTTITIPQSVGIIYEWAFSESGLESAVFEDTSSWKVRPHNYVPDESTSAQIITLAEADLADTETAALYLLKNSSFVATENIGGYSNYSWWKNDGSRN